MSRHRVVAALAVLLITSFAFLGVAHGRSVSCFPVLNDFWGNAFAADFWEWTPQRAWNGFFPPGYPLLLRSLPGDSLICSAYNFNVLAGTVLLAAVWVAMRAWGAPVWGLIALLLVALNPLVLTQALSSGPDAWFVVLTVIGTMLLFHALEVRPSIAVAVLGGICLGGSGWLRYHAFPWSAAVLLGAVALTGGRRANVLLAAAGPVLVSGLGLVTLGLAAGDLGAVQRGQAFNIFTRLVEPPNWFHLPTADTLPSTLWEAIARNPPKFWENYLAFSAPHVWLLVPPALGLVFGVGLVRRFALFTLVSVALFVPIVDLGASPRGVACALPLVLTVAAWTMSQFVERVAPGAWRSGVAAALALGLSAYVWQAWLPDLRGFVHDVRYRASMSRQLEATLRADRVRLASQVFSTTDLYFLGASGWRVVSYHPWVLGGWPTLDLDGYLETFPPPSTATLDAFLDDCQRVGVTHLALGAASGLVQRELGQIFEGGLSTPRVAELPGAPGVRLFRIVG